MVFGSNIIGSFLFGPSSDDGITTGGGFHTTEETAAQLEGWVRVRTHTVTEERLTPQMFLDWSNWAIAELVPKVYHNNDYLTTSVLGVGTSFDLSALKMRAIAKVVDATNGLITPKGSREYERIQAFPSLYANSAFWTQQGETLKVSYGSGLTGGSVTLYYHKVPDETATVEDNFDIDDSYYAFILEKVVREVEQWKASNN